MLRTPASIVRVAAIGALAAALTVGVATPALAFGPASITITPATTGEDPLTTHAVVCPLTSTDVIITANGIDGGSPIVYGPTTYALDGSGEYSDTFYEESFFDRDTDVTYSADCRDAGNVSVGNDSVIYHLPTTGAVSSAPASRGVNQDIVATGNCGTSANVNSVFVYAYQEPADTLIAGFPLVVPYTNVVDYSINVGTGDALGVPTGDDVLLSIVCQSTSPAPHSVSNRITVTTMTAAVVAAAPTALAATGSDIISPLAAGSLAIVGGALLLLRLRRRTTAV